MGDLYVKCKKYIELDYIKSTGTQWIDSGLSVATNTWVDVDLMFDSAFDYNMMFGQWNKFAVSLRAVNTVCASVGGSESQNIGSITTTGVKYNIIFGPGQGYIQNGIRTSFGGNSNTISDYNIFLFGAGASSSTPHQWTSFGVGKIYKFKIYNGITGDISNSNLLRDFVPCKIRATGEIGMYDRVEDKFYSNSGTGIFVEGSKVENTINKLAPAPFKKLYIGANKHISWKEDNSNCKLYNDGSTLTNLIDNVSFTNSGVTVSTTQSKFGGKSLFFNSGQYMKINCPNSGDFTLSMWVYQTSKSTNYPTPYTYTSGTRGIYHHMMGGGTTSAVVFISSGTNIGSTQSYSLNAWNHIAYTKKDGTLYSFFNGQLAGSIADTNTYNQLWLGTLHHNGAVDSGGCYFTGYIDDVAIFNTALWTEAFDVPTEPFTTNVNSVVRIVENYPTKIKKLYIGKSDASYGGVRYIRDKVSGSTSNTGCHWCEIQAFDKFGTNIALNKPVTILNGTSEGQSLTIPTDGNTATGSYLGAAQVNGYAQIEIDLGQVYDIDSVKVYHYYSDGRTYYSPVTEISWDGVNWITISDGVQYAETSSGKTWTNIPKLITDKYLLYSTTT